MPAARQARTPSGSGAAKSVERRWRRGTRSPRRSRPSAGDRRGDDVARREVGQRVRAGHEPRPGRGRRSTAPSPRTASVTSGRLPRAPGRCRARWGGTARTRGRRPSAPARRASAIPSPVGVGRVAWCRVELAVAAGGQHHGAARAASRRGPSPSSTAEAGDAAAGGAQRVDGDVLVEHGEPRSRSGGDERPLDLGAGGVAAGVHDPERRVPALAGAARGRPSAPGRTRAPRRPQPGDRGRRRRRGSATAAASQSPAPAARVSATCASTLSPRTSPSTAATPPCAQRVLPASTASLVTTTTRSRRPRAAVDSRRVGPDDDPVPTTHQVGAGLPARRRSLATARACRWRSSAGPRPGRARRAPGRRGPRRVPSRSAAAASPG